MIKIAIFNQKGGVGKTTLTVNLASCFSERWDKKVLVVDADAQCNSTAYLTATNPDEFIAEKNLYTLLEGKDKLNSCIYPISFYKNGHQLQTNISVLAGSKEVDLIDTDDATKLRKILLDVEDEYDFCFLDCSAQKTSINLLALAACNFVLVPIEPDVDSVNGYDMVLKLINSFKDSLTNETVKILGLLLNGVKTIGALDKYLRDKFSQEFDNLVFKATIRDSAIIRQARFFGLPVNYFKKSSNITLDYYSCALEIIEKVSEATRKVGR